MAFRLVKTEIWTLHTTEEVFARVDQLAAYGGTLGEREVSKAREGHIKAKILGGEMRPFSWAVGRSKKTGLKRRVNGQHSARVLKALTAEEWQLVQFPVVIFYEEWECDDDLDLPILFEQFDPNWSGRDTDDYIGAHLSHHDDFMADVSRYAAAHATAGIKWYVNTVEGVPMKDMSAQYQLIHQNSDIHRFLLYCGQHELNLTKEIRQMARPCVVAAMFHTSRGMFGEQGRRFWRQVSGGTHANVDEASHEYKLAGFLELVHSNGAKPWPHPAQRRMFHNKTAPNNLEIFATCLRVFVAWEEHKPLSEIVAPLPWKTAKEIVARLTPALPLTAAAD